MTDFVNLEWFKKKYTVSSKYKLIADRERETTYFNSYYIQIYLKVIFDKTSSYIKIKLETCKNFGNVCTLK